MRLKSAKNLDKLSVKQGFMHTFAIVTETVLGYQLFAHVDDWRVLVQEVVTE